MNTGKLIQDFRKKQGLSQEDLASEIGVARQTISKWELNDMLPDANNLKLLSKAFGVSTDKLLLNEEHVMDGNIQEAKQFSLNCFIKKHWPKIGYYFIYAGITQFLMSLLMRHSSQKNWLLLESLGMDASVNQSKLIFTGSFVVSVVFVAGGVAIIVYEKKFRK